MQNLLHQPDRDAILARVRNLPAAGKPRWGSFTAGQVMCHLADPFRVALGEKAAGPLRSPLGTPPLSWLVVWVLPWPKSAPTAAEFLPGAGMTPPGDFDRDRLMLIDMIERFSTWRAEFQRNPVFGRLDRRSWGRLMWRHVDHHLHQFGC